MSDILCNNNDSIKSSNMLGVCEYVHKWAKKVSKKSNATRFLDFVDALFSGSNNGGDFTYNMEEAYARMDAISKKNGKKGKNNNITIITPSGEVEKSKKNKNLTSIGTHNGKCECRIFFYEDIANKKKVTAFYVRYEFLEYCINKDIVTSEAVINKILKSEEPIYCCVVTKPSYGKELVIGSSYRNMCKELNSLVVSFSK